MGFRVSGSGFNDLVPRKFLQAFKGYGVGVCSGFRAQGGNGLGNFWAV